MILESNAMQNGNGVETGIQSVRYIVGRPDVD